MHNAQALSLHRALAAGGKTVRPWAVVAVALGVATGGCAGSGKFVHDRHSMSRLYTSGGGDLVFEASVSPDYPSDSESGEAARREWIEQWLAQRKLCPGGYTLLDRQPIGSAADNPYLHDLRYTLRCRE